MKWVGWALLIAGAAGAYYRYTLYQASSQGNPGLVNNSLKTFDPASMVGMTPGTGLLDLPMGIDAAVIVVGALLVSGKSLI
jgi:hypothetical protein